MEGKKVLWVVFSIALALVVILAAGLFLLRPRQPGSAAQVRPGAAPSLQGYDPYEYVRGPSAPPGLTPPPAESEPVVIVEGIWPNRNFETGIGINVLTSADPGWPNGGAVFHDTAVWIRKAP